MDTDYDLVIVGAGFYGLNIARYLCEKYQIKIAVIESEAAPMSRASLINQARVHAGYHYPLSIRTALSCQKNYQRFTDDFSDCLDRTFTAYYGIARDHSSISADRFYDLCRLLDAPIRPVTNPDPALFSPAYLEKVFEVEECAFNAKKISAKLTDDLTKRGVELFCERAVRSIRGTGTGLECITDREVFSARRVIVAAYGQVNSLLHQSGLPVVAMNKQLTELALCRSGDARLQKIALTVMCGPFFSFMPYPTRGVMSLSHVRYTPLVKYSEVDYETFAKSELELDRIRNRKVTNFELMKKDAVRFMPALESLEYVGSIYETKALLKQSEHDEGRPILFLKDYGLSDLCVILGGKLDNIYDCFPRLDTLFLGG